MKYFFSQSWFEPEQDRSGGIVSEAAKLILNRYCKQTIHVCHHHQYPSWQKWQTLFSQVKPRMQAPPEPEATEGNCNIFQFFRSAFYQLFFPGNSTLFSLEKIVDFFECGSNSELKLCVPLILFVQPFMQLAQYCVGYCELPVHSSPPLLFHTVHILKNSTDNFF